MSYSQDKFNDRALHLKVAAHSFGTATGTSVATTAVAAKTPIYIRRTEVTGGKFFCTTIPNAAATALILHVMNGTDTVGTCVLTTATASQNLPLVITTQSNATFAAGVGPTYKITGTATASADALGAYDISLEEGERFA